MIRVGLTGGIGSGKSAVSARLAEHGARVVDADLLARVVVAPGTPGLAAVAEAFGPDVLTADGALDRPALGRLVFGDDEARARLNALVHPRVADATLRAFTEAERDGVEVVVHDVPLLVEVGLDHGYDEVVVVMAPEPVRLDRLVRLRGMDEAEARARIAAQATDEQRRAAATVLLVNDGTLADLHAQVDALWEQLRER
ncbi:MAG: dephospho-CoA kinase [Actinomycetota bacterium]|nr:dephospho-CoA kinase [Actinomycetota bacterium]